MSAGTPTIDERDQDDGFTPVGPPMTLADFHALPDDPNVERMLIHGQLWEKPMTKRTRKHSRLVRRIGQVLGNWADSQPRPRPDVYSGEIGCDLPELGTGVGIDVAVVSAELEAELTDDDKYIIGAPTLVVEILSPSDRVQEINLKLDNYLEAGVALVWVVDPFRKTIVQYQKDAAPKIFTPDDKITGDPYLPGFSVDVSRIFGR